jgi:hypothetical protein
MTTAHGGSRWSLWSEAAVLSIASKGSVLSIGSIGSFLSVGSIGSAASLFSAGSVARRGVALLGRLEVVRPVVAKPPRRRAMNGGGEHGRLVPHRARPLSRLSGGEFVRHQRWRSSWSTVDW